jgi:ubiquinone/menaquinone biosynthesis C-methylase UbiE
MGFNVPAEAYDRFMGRYSVPLAPVFAEFAEIAEVAGVADADRGTGRRRCLLDVGCGPGALTSELVRRAGTAAVVAVDPSPPFVEAIRSRHPAVEVHLAGAEQLPFGDGCFDAAAAQLVVHFMTDPVGGLREMGRVTRPGGVVAACVWDFDEGGATLSLFWRTALDLDPSAPGEAARPGARRGELARMLGDAGFVEITQDTLSVTVHHDTFEEWWEPFELGVGPAGAYVSTLDQRARRNLRERCRDRQPAPPFGVTAVAWAARGRVPMA